MSEMKEVNVETGEVVLRDFNEEEIEFRQKMADLEEAELLKQRQEKAAKTALLDRLGITEEEAKLLLS
jgi:hypothetical protein